MGAIEQLLERNKAWARGVVAEDPDFFNRLASQQAPDYLWIGCSDSRVPANQILSLPPGEVFVHRNIANVVAASDLNLLSVLQFAVDMLKVKHVIVCGHYSCGGIRASLSDANHGLIDNWLNHLRLIRRLHDRALAGLEGEAREVKLTELNVIEQVRNVARTTIVRNAWGRGQDLTLHGLVYAVSDGILHPLASIAGFADANALVPA